MRGREVKERKREEAKARQVEWDKLTPQEQLATLDKQLGKGTGAKKQRARLQGLIDNPKLKNRKKGKK